MRFALCLVLGLYSIGLISFSASELLTADAECTNCFKGETAFEGGKGPNGEASTPTNRYVNVGFVAAATSPFKFAGADATKVSNAIDLAAGAWNTHQSENNTGTVPYHVQQTTSGNNVNVTVVLADEVPGHPDACGGIDVKVDANGKITKATMVLKKEAFQRLSDADVAKLIEHELGHFFGLENIGDSGTGQCESIMDKAGENCSQPNHISNGDVTAVRKHVNDNTHCRRKRTGGLNPQGGGGVDPTYVPNLYPRTCYYYWTEDPHYNVETGEYLYSDFYLDFVICY